MLFLAILQANSIFLSFWCVIEERFLWRRDRKILDCWTLSCCRSCGHWRIVQRNFVPWYWWRHQLHESQHKFKNLKVMRARMKGNRTTSFCWQQAFENLNRWLFNGHLRPRSSRCHKNERPEKVQDSNWQVLTKRMSFSFIGSIWLWMNLKRRPSKFGLVCRHLHMKLLFCVNDNCSSPLKAIIRNTVGHMTVKTLWHDLCVAISSISCKKWQRTLNLWANGLWFGMPARWKRVCYVKDTPLEQGTLNVAGDSKSCWFPGLSWSWPQRNILTSSKCTKAWSLAIWGWQNLLA